jgi:hypothetical protein
MYEENQVTCMNYYATCIVVLTIYDNIKAFQLIPYVRFRGRYQGFSHVATVKSKTSVLFPIQNTVVVIVWPVFVFAHHVLFYVLSSLLVGI